MSHLQLNSSSLMYLRVFHTLRNVVAAIVILYAVASWFFGAPRVSGSVFLCVIIGWYGCLTILTKLIRCPHCTEAALPSFRPSWLNGWPFGERVSFQCVHCCESIDISGGTSPPSNISLQADREP
jgi:hypothetical protein